MRHIPTGDTFHAGVLTFEEALTPSVSDYDRERWIYVPDHYSEYRYILGTRGNRPLICIGINPSTAAPERLDNTLKSAQRIALYNGYDSFIMFNVYAQRATIPDDMEKTMNPLLHRENMKAFSWILEQVSESGTPDLWAAWGAVIEKRDYLAGCVRDMAEIGNAYGARWWTAGARSKAGHPHHPLYLKSETALDPFPDLQEYLGKIGKTAHQGKQEQKPV